MRIKLQQVIQCTYFVKEYCNDKSFGTLPLHRVAIFFSGSITHMLFLVGMRAVKNITSKVSERMEQYITNLKTLQSSLGSASAIEGSVMIHRVAVDILEQGEILKNIGE